MQAGVSWLASRSYLMNMTGREARATRFATAARHQQVRFRLVAIAVID